MLTAAIALAILAVAYFVLTTHVDLHPLNNVSAATPRERRMEIALNAPLMLLPAALLAVAGALKLTWLAVAGSALELVVALGGLLLWWLPNLEHMILHALLVATSGTSKTKSVRRISVWIGPRVLGLHSFPH